jgi:hypothetical protein
VPRRETLGSTRVLGAGALVDRAIRFFVNYWLRVSICRSWLSLTLPIHKKLALAAPAAHNCSDMDRFLGEFVATMIGGMVTIFTVAVALLRRLRKRQLRRVNQQLDEILADSTVPKDGSFTQSL